MKQKILSVIHTLALCLSLVPVTGLPAAAAEPTDSWITYNITVTVTEKTSGNLLSGVVVTLMQGRKQVGDPETTGVDGTCNFENVPVGLYNVVAEQGAAPDKKTMAAMVDLTAGNKNVPIQMPSDNVNSVLDVGTGEAIRRPPMSW